MMARELQDKGLRLLVGGCDVEETWGRRDRIEVKMEKRGI